MAEPASPKYAVNPETGQVMRNDGTGWQKVKTAKNPAGDVLINEGGQWKPLPGRTSAPAPAGFQAAPKMSITQAAEVAGAQGKEFSFADEASALKRSVGIPKGVDKLLDANPMNRFVNMGIGAGAAIADAAGVKLPQSYTQAKDAENALLAQAREDRPATAFVSEVAQSLPYPGGALRMGAPIVRESAKMAGIGVLQGGAYGFGAGEGAGRIESAGTGAAVGGALGAATPGVAAAALPAIRGTRTALANATDAIVEMFGGTGTAGQAYARQVAEAAVRRSAERSGMTPERILETLQRFGNKPAVLAEVIGQDAVNTLSSLTRRPGSTPQAAQDIIAERMGGFPERAADDLRQTTGLTDAQIRGEFGPELAARREAAAPAYTELFEQQGGVASPRLDQLANTNAIRPMIGRAQEVASDIAVSQGRDPASVTRLEVLDTAKRLLDDDVARAMRNEDTTELVRLEGLRVSLLQELDTLTGGQYAAARDLGGEAPRLQEARTQGEQALRPGVTRATVNEQVNALNPQDRAAFASGTASVIDESIAGGRMLPQRFRLPANREKVEAAFGPEAGGEFANRMTAEAELRDLASRWGPRQGSITGTVMESGPSEALDDGIRFATSIARGDRIGFINQAVSWMRRRGYNQQQIDAMGELLLSNPQEGLRRLGIQLPQLPGGGAAAGAAAGAPQPAQVPPGSAPPPNALSGATMPGQPANPTQTQGLGTRAADATAVAAIASGGQTAQADTGDAQGRIDELTQSQTAAQQLITEYEQGLKAFEALSPLEKQRFLKDNGFKGEDGKVLTLDGGTGDNTTFAINNYKAEIEQATAAAKAERELFRKQINDVRVSLAEQDEKPSNPWVDKGLEIGTYAAAIYAAHRVRGMAVKGSQKAARGVEANANALLTRLPVPPETPKRTLLSRVPVVGTKENARITRETNAANKAQRATEERLAGRDIPPISSNLTSENGLPVRTANLGEFDRRRAAGDFGPAGPVSRFMEPVTSRIRPGDASLMAAGATDAYVMEGMLEKTRADITAEEQRLDEARKANNGAGDPIRIQVSRDRLKELRNIETTFTVLQRVGVGLAIGGAIATTHGRYAKPQPRFEAAERERDLINRAMAPPPPPPANALAPPVPAPRQPRTPPAPKPKPPVAFSTARPRRPSNDND